MQNVRTVSLRQNGGVAESDRERAPVTFFNFIASAWADNV